MKMASLICTTLVAIFHVGAIAAVLRGSETASVVHVHEGAPHRAKRARHARPTRCRRSPLALGALAEKDGKSLPGVGMDASSINPYETVYKDGFNYVSCAKDNMHDHGDRFDKASYELGDHTNVSIIHYAETVPKEDQEEMTHEVCFQFCRTLQHMNYFGIHHGRDCYCTPYYQRVAGDSSRCDQVCSGQPTTMCGGKTKSSIFEMHMCNDLGTDLMKAANKSETLRSGVSELAAAAKALADGMTTAADDEQKMWGQAGDPVAADLMQTTKVWAGRLLELAKTATNACEESWTHISKANSIRGKDFLLSDHAEVADRVIIDLVAGTAKVNAAEQELQEAYNEASRGVSHAHGHADGRGLQYYPIMYFVDKEFVSVPSTCGGDWDQKTVFKTDYDGCAFACDHATGSSECQGFFLSQNGLCFLFSKINTVTYYTKCQFSVYGDFDAAKGKPSALIQQGLSGPAAPDLSFVNARIDINNLHGQHAGPKIVLIKDVGFGIDLKLEATTDGFTTMKNKGAYFNGKFLELKVKDGVPIKFTFIDANSGSEVKMFGFPFTVFDLDGYQGVMETVAVSGYESRWISPDSTVKEENGVFKATREGTKRDNPTDPDNMDDLSLKSGVCFFFKDTASFTVTPHWPPNGVAGRGFMFSFTSHMTELADTTTQPVASDQGPVTTQKVAAVTSALVPVTTQKAAAVPIATTSQAPITTLQSTTSTTTPLGPGLPAGCYAKLEDFVGADTMLNPDTAHAKAGKSKYALKDANRADRCYR